MVNRKIISLFLGLGLFLFVIQQKILTDVTITHEIDNSEVECLARNIYFEARNQPIKGQEAVAHVTLNRLKSGKHGNSICKVVYQPHAFSWTLNSRSKMNEIKAETLAREIAFNTLLGNTKDPTHGATHYHANYVKTYWSKRLEKKVRIQDHIFDE